MCSLPKCRLIDVNSEVESLLEISWSATLNLLKVTRASVERPHGSRPSVVRTRQYHWIPPWRIILPTRMGFCAKTQLNPPFLQPQINARATSLLSTDHILLYDHSSLKKNLKILIGSFQIRDNNLNLILGISAQANTQDASLGRPNVSVLLIYPPHVRKIIYVALHFMGLHGLF